MPVATEVGLGSSARSRQRQRRQQAPASRPSAGSSPPYGLEELRALFTLNPDDLIIVGAARKQQTRLGLALLLVWARVEHRFVSDPAILPAEVIAFVASQLGLPPQALSGYGRRPATRTAHVATICRHLGLRLMGRGDEEQLGQFLEAKVAQTGGLSALREPAEGWLVQQGLLRPTEAMLDRLIQQARATAEERLFALIAGQLGKRQREQLDALCETQEGESALVALRTPPRAPSASSLQSECRRLVSIRELLPKRIAWGVVTQNRRRQWAGMVRRLYAQALRRYPANKRHTLLVAFLTVRAEEVQTPLSRRSTR